MKLGLLQVAEPVGGQQVWPEMWHIIGDRLAGVLRTGEAGLPSAGCLAGPRIGTQAVIEEHELRAQTSGAG